MDGGVGGGRAVRLLAAVDSECAGFWFILKGNERRVGFSIELGLVPRGRVHPDGATSCGLGGREWNEGRGSAKELGPSRRTRGRSRSRLLPWPAQDGR